TEARCPSPILDQEDGARAPAPDSAVPYAPRFQAAQNTCLPHPQATDAASRTRVLATPSEDDAVAQVENLLGFGGEVLKRVDPVFADGADRLLAFASVSRPRFQAASRA